MLYRKRETNLHLGQRARTKLGPNNLPISARNRQQRQAPRKARRDPVADRVGKGMVGKEARADQNRVSKGARLVYCVQERG